MIFRTTALLLTSFSVFASADWKAKDIMDKNEAARKVTELQADGKIIIDGGNRKRQEKTFSWWRKIQKDGIHYNTLTKFHTPSTVKNQSILFLEASGERNEILMYLPAFKKTRIVESSQQNQSFMASDFSYNDITNLQNEDYNYTENGIEPCPVEKSVKCYHIVGTIKNPRSIERLGYSKLNIWIRQDNFMADRVHYFNKEGKLYKELNTGKITAVTKTTYFLNYLEMKNLLNGQFTILEFSNLNFKSKIPDNKFFKNRLGKDD
jgi:hypothetical protein